jgi:hypothetical protein
MNTFYVTHLTYIDKKNSMFVLLTFHFFGFKRTEIRFTIENNILYTVPFLFLSLFMAVKNLVQCLSHVF